MKNNNIVARKEAISMINDYVKKKNDYIFIHYARGNFYANTYEKGPRVIAIVVMNAESEQRIIFSLEKTAEYLGYRFYEVDDKTKDKIEYSMLDEFFKYVEKNKEKKWIHWNMRDNYFGFSAIENRFQELDGKPFNFDESKLYNISILLRKKYGTNFALKNKTKWNGKLVGRMYDIFVFNDINDQNILNGEQEVMYYLLNNVLSVEQSVKAKLKAFKVIMEKAADNTLKTRGNVIKDIYGLSIFSIAQYIQDNALLAFLFSVLGGIIASVLYNIIWLRFGP